MIMWLCKFPLPSCTFIVLCIYVQLQETVTVYVIKYLSIYLSEILLISGVTPETSVGTVSYNYNK